MATTADSSRAGPGQQPGPVEESLRSVSTVQFDGRDSSSGSACSVPSPRTRPTTGSPGDPHRLPGASPTTDSPRRPSESPDEVCVPHDRQCNGRALPRHRTRARRGAVPSSPPKAVSVADGEIPCAHVAPGAKGTRLGVALVAEPDLGPVAPHSSGAAAAPACLPVERITAPPGPRCSGSGAGRGWWRGDGPV